MARWRSGIAREGISGSRGVQEFVEIAKDEAGARRQDSAVRPANPEKAAA